MPNWTRPELLLTIERRLRSQLARALEQRGVLDAALLFATEQWRRKSYREIQQQRDRLKGNPLLLWYYNCLLLERGINNTPPDSDHTDQFVEALNETLSYDKLKFVADRLSRKMPGRHRSSLADISAEDFYLWVEATRRRRDRGTMSARAACIAVAREDRRYRTTDPDALAKHYRRIDQRFGCALREIFKVTP